MFEKVIIMKLIASWKHLERVKTLLYVPQETIELNKNYGIESTKVLSINNRTTFKI